MFYSLVGNESRNKSSNSSTGDQPANRIFIDKESIESLRSGSRNLSNLHSYGAMLVKSDSLSKNFRSGRLAKNASKPTYLIFNEL